MTPNQNAEGLKKGDWLLLDGDPVRFSGYFEDSDGIVDEGFVCISGDDFAAYAIRRFTFLARPENPDDPEGWVKHDGGPNPALGLRVDVRGKFAVYDSDSESLRWDRVELWRPHQPSPRRMSRMRWGRRLSGWRSASLVGPTATIWAMSALRWMTH